VRRVGRPGDTEDPLGNLVEAVVECIVVAVRNLCSPRARAEVAQAARTVASLEIVNGRKTSGSESGNLSSTNAASPADQSPKKQASKPLAAIRPSPLDSGGSTAMIFATLTACAWTAPNSTPH
jgi:hypothetical protein